MSEFTPFTLMGQLPGVLEKACEDYTFKNDAVNAVINYSNSLLVLLGEIPQWATKTVDETLPDEPESKHTKYTLSLDQLESLIDGVLRQYNVEIDFEQREQLRPALKYLHYDLAKCDQPIVPNMGVTAWLASDEVGSSSKFMVTYLHDSIPTSEYEFPYDESDFERCLQAVVAIPYLSSRLNDMASLSPAWKALVEHWDTLSALVNNEDDTWSEVTAMLGEYRQATG